MSSADPHSPHDPWRLPPPPPPIPPLSELTRLSYARFLRLAPWLAGLAAAATLGVYSGPHVDPLRHVSSYFAALIGGALVVTTAAARRDWIRRYTLPSLFGPPTTNFRQLVNTLDVPGHFQALEVAAAAANEREYGEDLLKAPAYSQWVADLERVHADNRSPWRDTPRYAAYLEAVQRRQADLQTLATAAQCVQRTRHTATLQDVHQLQEMASTYPSGHPLATLLTRLAQTAHGRLAERLQKEEHDRAHQAALEKSQARERMIRAKIESQERLERERRQLQRDAEAVQHARTCFLDSLSDLETRLEADMDTLVRLQRTIQDLPRRAFEGVAEDVDIWISRVAAMNDELLAIKRRGMETDSLTGVDELKPLRSELEQARHAHWHDMAQLQGIDVADKQLEVHFPDLDAPTLVLAFLEHINAIAEHDALVAKLWRTVDRNGNICLYYYGPQGQPRPKWRAVCCKISIVPSSRQSWRLHGYLYVPIGIDDDESLYKWCESNGLYYGDLDKRLVRYHVAVNRLNRDQSSRHDFEDHLKRFVDEKDKSKLKYRYQNKDLEETSRTFSTHVDNFTGPANRHQPPHEDRKGREDNKQERHRNESGSRRESKHSERHQKEDSEGTKKGRTLEAGYEIKETVEFVFVHLEWDRAQLLEQWKMSGDNQHSRQMFDRIVNLIVGARNELDRVGKQALARRAGARATDEDGGHRFDAAFWSKAQKLALLERDFPGWPFVFPQAFHYDGRPRNEIGDHRRDDLMALKDQLPTLPPQLPAAAPQLPKSSSRHEP